MTREEAISWLKEANTMLKNEHIIPYYQREDTIEAIDMAIHELEIQAQKAKCRKCEHYRCGENIFPYCEINPDDRKAFVCKFEERKRR